MTIPHIKVPEWENISWLHHGFFTRIGGVSVGAYEGLNAALDKGDNDEHVWENRRRIASVFDLGIHNLAKLRQKHTNTVIFANQPFSGPESQEGDGLVTHFSNILLSVETADCVPVLFVDIDHRIAGAAHAGWKGALSGVTDNTIQTMVENGAKIDSIHVALGPCIWQESYEIGAEFFAQFGDVDPTNSQHFSPSPQNPEKYYFDLPGYITKRLLQKGVSTIYASPANTFADPETFFSFRRRTLFPHAVIGNQFSVIAIKE